MNHAPRTAPDPDLLMARRRKRMTKRAQAMTLPQLRASLRDQTNNMEARGLSAAFIGSTWYVRLLTDLIAQKEGPTSDATNR